MPLNCNHSSSNGEHKKCDDYVEGIFKKWEKEFWGTFNSLDHYYLANWSSWEVGGSV